MYKNTLRFLSLAFAFFAFFSLSLAADSTTFKDVLRTHDQYVSIDYLRSAGITGGYDDGTYRPTQPINRAEALKIILQGSNIEPAVVTDELLFPDIDADDWYAPYAIKAKELEIVAGDAQTGAFSASRQINKAEFLKMLLLANNIKVDSIPLEAEIASDVPAEAWFASFINYALKSGLIAKNDQGFALPNQSVDRAGAAEMMYLLLLIKKSGDTQFLLHRAEAELAQIEVYIAANKVANAKKAGDLAVSLTQQAIKNLPNDKVVLGAGKLAKAYSWLVDSFIYGIQQNKEKAEELANEAIKKATEAWEVNSATQPIARHIKDRAREILVQIGGVEYEAK